MFGSLRMERSFGTAIKLVLDNLVATNNYPSTEAGVDQAIRDLVAVHATEEDRREVLQSLRNSHKDRPITVMAFYYRLLEINGYVSWLPGTGNPLDADEIKSAFFNAMPGKCKERFELAGHSQTNFTIAEFPLNGLKVYIVES